MNWFNGVIPDAIQSAKTKRSLIIVYITGDDIKSKECDALWEDNNVIEACKKNEYVALKLAANSDSCKQFSAIYPVVVIPCTFLIGDNGVPVDIVACETNSDAFVAKLNAAFKKHEASKSLLAPPDGASSPSGGDGSQTGAGSEAAGAAVACSTAENCAEASLSKEERVQRAKDSIAQKQDAKLAEEKENERRGEIERRELGHSAAQLAQRKQEAELRESKKQWLKDKEADKVARDRVRAQIAQDRAEKSEAYQKEKEAKEREKRDKDDAKKMRLDEEERSAREEEERLRRETARIQFRLPDGSSVTHNFPATDALSAVDAFISHHTENRPQTLTLSTLYPRRTFTTEDMKEMLADLGLSPSAVIMVVSTPQTYSTVPSNPLFTLISFITAPLSLVWNFLYGVFFGFSTPSATSQAIPPSDRGRNSGDQAPPTDGGSPRMNRPQTCANLQSYRRRIVCGHTDGDPPTQTATFTAYLSQMTTTTKMPRGMATPRNKCDRATNTKICNEFQFETYR